VITKAHSILKLREKICLEENEDTTKFDVIDRMTINSNSTYQDAQRTLSTSSRV